MADQRIQSTEKMVGAGHGSLADTLNRHALIEHENDGTHKHSHGELYQRDLSGYALDLPLADTWYKFDDFTVGLESGAGLIVGDAGNDQMVVGASGPGRYGMTMVVDFAGPTGQRLQFAPAINGTTVDKATSVRNMPGGNMRSASAVDIRKGTLDSGTLSDTVNRDGEYYQVNEEADPTGFAVDFTFDTPAAHDVHFWGRYEGSAGDSVEMQARNFTKDPAELTHGGTDYVAIRDHNSAAADEPGVGADWDSYWYVGGSGGDAWVTATDYISGFDNLRAAEKDLPHAADASEDYFRQYEIPGPSHHDYGDGTNVIIRIIHTTSGNINHDLYVDKIAITDHYSNLVAVDFSPVNLVASDTIDLRVQNNLADQDVLIYKAKLVLDRMKI